MSALSRMIVEKRARSVVISGPTGVGKTTLALVYAQALLCENPDAAGSPCLACEACHEFDEGYCPAFQPYYAGRQRVDDMREIVDVTQKRDPFPYDRRVYLFDEAGSMGPDAVAVLLTEIPRPKHPAVFIFTLIDEASLGRPMLGRLMSVRLADAEPTVGADNLKVICEAEGLGYDLEALELLAGTTTSFREAVNDLQTLAPKGRVTVELVREQVLGPRHSWLERYFQALTAGDLGGELAALRASALAAVRRADLIVGLLTTLKVNYIGQTPTRAARRYSVVSEESCVQILDAFETIAAARGGALSALLDEVLKFWVMGPARVSDETLDGHVARLHDLLHAGERAAQPPTQAAVPAQVQSARLARRAITTPSSGRRRLRSGLATSASRAAYLSFAQTAELYEAATFALQAYWTPFNAIIKLEWDVGVGRRDEEIARDASDFAHHLQLRLKGFNRVLLHERDSAGTMRTTIVGHVPDRYVARARTWLEKPGLGEKWHVSIEKEVEPASAVRPKAIDQHWSLMRELWRGVDPTLPANDTASLLDVLEIAPYRRRRAGVVACRRFAVSDRLGPLARQEAGEALFPHVSAFADRQWDWVYRGWELGENAARERERSIWARRMATLEAQFGGVGVLEEGALARGVEKEKQKQIDRFRFKALPWSGPRSVG